MARIDDGEAPDHGSRVDDRARHHDGPISIVTSGANHSGRGEQAWRARPRPPGPFHEEPAGSGIANATITRFVAANCGWPLA